jgi:topoisomerase IA-like protein
MPKYSKKAGDKVERAMHEKKAGTLKSGRSGKKVTSRKQAIAIGLSEAREAGAKVPKKAAKKSAAKKSTAKKTTRKAAKKKSAAKKSAPKKTSRKNRNFFSRKGAKGETAKICKQVLKFFALCTLGAFL